MDSRWDFLSMKNSQRLWRSLLFITLLAALCGSSVLPTGETSVHAAPLAQSTSCTTFVGWTFAGNSDLPSTGTGSLTRGSGLGSPQFLGGPTSSETPAIGFNGWTTANTFDVDDYVEFKVSTLGYKSIRLTFDSRIASGPSKFEVRYSIDGTTFTPFGTPIDSDTGSSWDTQIIDLSSITALDDTTDVFIRLYGYLSSDVNGTWRLDNVVFCGVPIVTIDSFLPNPTNSGTTLTWHSIVNGDFTVRVGGADCNSGTVLAPPGTYTTSPNQVSFSIDGSALAEGTNTVRVCLIDTSGHTNFTSGSVTKETVAPTVVIDRASSQAGSTSSLPIDFTVTFSEEIKANTFEPSDITQSGTATGIVWSVIDSGNHRIFTLRAATVTNGGTLVPSLAAGKVTDLAGNNNTASTSPTSNIVTYTPATPLTVLINEVAWGGTVASIDDEWIELYNPSTTATVDLNNWKLKSSDNTPDITLSGSMPPNTFLVIARNVGTFQAQPAVIYSTINLSNNGEILTLTDQNSRVVSTANSDGGSWPAGSNSSPYASMERIGSADQWITYAGTIPVAYDRATTPNAIRGTPGKPNWISTTTVTTITSDTLDPSAINQNVTVTVTVVGGTTTPTGTVNVTGADTNCVITLLNGTGSCLVKFTSTGTKTITATYGGDGAHPASSDTESHQVNTTAAAATPFRTATPVPAPPPPLLVINEFVPRPGHDWNNDGIVNVKDEYIEILNHGTIDVNLSGYSLDDEVNLGSDPYSLPSVTLKPGERVVFYGSETNLLLGDGGDGVRLLKPNGQLMDAYNYFVVGYPDQAFCRLPDNGGADDWNQYCYPTPGLQNSLSGSFNPPPGNGEAEVLCPIADTLPIDFIFAECPGFGYGIWRAEFWDKLGWLGEKILPEIDGKWPVFAD